MSSSRAIINARQRILRMLTDTIHILRPTASVGEWGEQLNQYDTIEVVPGRVIGQRKLDPQDYGMQEVTTTTYRIVLPHGTVVGQGDAIKVNDKMMDVIGVDTRLTDGVDVQITVAARDG